MPRNPRSGELSTRYRAARASFRVNFFAYHFQGFRGRVFHVLMAVFQNSRAGCNEKHAAVVGARGKSMCLNQCVGKKLREGLRF